MSDDHFKHLEAHIKAMDEQMKIYNKLLSEMGRQRIFLGDHVKISSWYGSKKTKRVDYHRRYSKKKRTLLFKWED